MTPGCSVHPAHHSAEAGRQEERHLRVHGVLHPPGVFQWLDGFSQFHCSHFFRCPPRDGSLPWSRQQWRLTTPRPRFSQASTSWDPSSRNLFKWEENIKTIIWFVFCIQWFTFNQRWVMHSSPTRMEREANCLFLKLTTLPPTLRQHVW